MRSRVSSLAVLALGLMLAPAGFAQQQNGTTGASSDNAASKTEAAPAPDGSQASKKSASKSAPSGAHMKPGTDYPRWEAFAGFSFTDIHPKGAITGTIKGYGGSASLAYNLNNWAGLVADFGGYHIGHISGVPVDVNVFSYLFGPRFSYRNPTRFTPFAQILFGAAHCGAACNGGSSTGFTLTAGGGLDISLSNHFSWRAIQTEYLMTKFNNPGGANPQNGVRISTGLLFRWGARPEMVNRPPSASLTADKTSVTSGSGEVVGLHCTANDPDGDSLAYTWTATAGRVDGTGAETRWTEGGAGPGSPSITCHVDDGHGGTASASVGLSVVAPPPPPAPKPPVMSCSVDRSTVMAGERVGVTATASSPAGYTLSYAWRANSGQVVGTGSSVQFDTTGLAPGTYTITGRADDGHGQAADCSTSVTVQQPPPPPQASKINECAFKPASSARVDNVCKRVLDDVALRLQNEPKGTVVIVGFADPKDKRADKMSTSRAQNAATYLAGKGIDKSRITVRAGSGQAGAGAANQRIDIVWVPEGASY